MSKMDLFTKILSNFQSLSTFEKGAIEGLFDRVLNTPVEYAHTAYVV